MKVLVVNPLNTWWSYQLSLELIYKYKNLGNEVFWFNGANNNIKLYEINRSDQRSYLLFKNPVKSIFKILSKDKIKGKFSFVRVTNDYSKKSFNSINDLKSYEVGGAPVGKIIFSTIAYRRKDTGFDVKKFKPEIEYHQNYIYSLEKELLKTLLDFNPNYVVTIQDRLIGSSLSISIAKNLNIKTKVYYWGSHINKIDSFNESLYNYDEWRDKIDNKVTNNFPNTAELKRIMTKIELLGETPSKDSKSFTKRQMKGKSLTIGSKKIIVFYASSEHEHSPIFISNNHKFKSQYDAFEALQNICLKNEYQLVLKHHPTRYTRNFLKNSRNYRINDWNTVKIFSNTIELFPDSDIDTYRLMADAYINVTWNSTVGLECLAREINLVVVGDAAWLDKKNINYAWDFTTLERRICDGPAKLNKNVLVPWFWYTENFGEEFIYVKTNMYNPSVGGIEIFVPRLGLGLLYQIFRKLKVKLNIEI
jgi:hypothetical protein